MRHPVRPLGVMLLCRLRELSVLTTIVFTAGCASVKILSADIAAIDSKNLVVALTTNKDLQKYDHTYYAYQVYLSYRPSNTRVSSEFEKPPKPWSYPFSASFSGSEVCGARRYCSRWAIPIANSANLDLNLYEYTLGHADSLRLKIGGGSMGGGRLSSNVVVVKIP